MSGKLEIRKSIPGDYAAIERLYPDAFPDEDLLPLVRELLQAPADTLSLVGALGRRLVAHVIFTNCCVEGSSVKAALLGPLAVASEWQRQGIGSALVRAGLLRLEEDNVSVVYVLGDPAFYACLGFAPESSVAPPYSLPAEWEAAWQSQVLGDAAGTLAGKLSVPRQWRQAALWAP